jgi:hypothetical protein
VLDPSRITQFEVIQVYYEFQGEPPDYKYFVAVCHEDIRGGKHVLCMKATSKTTKYDNDKAQKAGCVCYEEGECGCFPEKTVVQPDNMIPISYEHLIEQEKRGKFKHKGKLPDDFREKIIQAVKASITVPPKWKDQILKKLGA